MSVEAKLSTEFGKRIDNSQTDAESKSTEVTKEINYFFPPYKDTLLTLDTRSVQTQRWLRINGVSNVGLTVSWPVSLTWALSGGHPPYANLVGGGNPIGLVTSGHGDAQRYTITFDTWQEFEEFLEGFNTDFPAMHGWLRSAETSQISTGYNTFEPLGPHLSKIRATSIRAVVFSGMQHESEDGVITATPQDVTGQDLGAVQTRLGLPDDLTHDPNGRITPVHDANDPDGQPVG